MDAGHKHHRERALSLVKARGIARARDFQAASIPGAFLQRLVESGEIIKLSRGLYQAADDVGRDASHDLARAARLVPHGVISLMSALDHHGLTDQRPDAVWMTIPHRARTPKSDTLRLVVVRATGEAMSSGVEHTLIEGVSVPVYGVAKTIADCFKHRRHVGEAVAVQALCAALDQQKTSPDDLMAYARINRVAAKMDACLTPPHGG